MSGLAVILTALDLEYRAVREKLTDPQVHRHPAGTRFEVGNLGHSRSRAAIALVGKGNHPAAVLAERAIAEFAPVAVLFVGIAGALWPDIALGDVVVATHVYAYHGATSEDDGLKGRPRVWEISHGPDQIARHIARTSNWARGLPPGRPIPAVRFGPIAAGEVVQDSALSDQARWVRDHYNDALAIEMEAAGVAQAGHLNNSLPVIVVRGISDRADGSKAATDGARWQPRAAANAAAFGIALAGGLITELQTDRPAEARGMVRRTEMSGGVTNVATDHAQVGFQAGQIIGDVRVVFGPGPGTPTDLSSQIAALAAEVADFREQLRQAHTTGRLDESTYLAAEAELEIVTDSLAESTGQGKSRLMVALKKLRGLIADVTELAANLATIITAVKGMS